MTKELVAGKQRRRNARLSFPRELGPGSALTTLGNENEKTWKNSILARNMDSQPSKSTARNLETEITGEVSRAGLSNAGVRYECLLRGSSFLYSQALPKPQRHAKYDYHCDRSSPKSLPTDKLREPSDASKHPIIMIIHLDFMTLPIQPLPSLRHVPHPIHLSTS